MEFPDEWRIDLDPMPHCDLARTRRVARAAQDLLAELGIRGFPKTSGGHGLHIYVRIVPEWGFADVRRAARAFGRELTRRVPADATVVWWRKDRDPSKVFVDFNQNARDHTMAAAYSVRSTPRATVMLFGLTPPGTKLEVLAFEDIFKKELTITGSYINPLVAERVIALMASGRLDMSKIVTDRVPLERGVEVFTDPAYRTLGKVVIGDFP